MSGEQERCCCRTAPNHTADMTAAETVMKRAEGSKACEEAENEWHTVCHGSPRIEKSTKPNTAFLLIIRICSSTNGNRNRYPDIKVKMQQVEQRSEHDDQLSENVVKLLLIW